jgi:uncharacterized protein (TIGR03083 family)
MSVRDLMRDERRDIRAFLATLTPEQWAAESLCAGWTVRDLVAHLVGWDDLLLYRSRREQLQALVRFAGLYAASFGSMRGVNRRIQRWCDGLGPTELLGRFGVDDGADLKWLFDGSNPGAHLAEYVVHHQDIRRPLGLAREIPEDRLVAALDGVTKLPGVRLAAWWKRRGRRWEATDVSWFAGRGPVTRAPGETILMVFAGRSSALDELTERSNR